VKSGSKDDLDRHLREKHQQGNTAYACGVLGCKRYFKVFPRTHNLFEHYKNMHPWHGEVILNREPLTEIVRGSNVPVSDQSSSSLPSAPLEDPFPNIGTYLPQFDGGFEFNEGTHYDGRAQNGHDLPAVSGLPQTSGDGFGYSDNTALSPGPSAAGPDDTSQGQDVFHFTQEVGGDGGQMEIQRRISILSDKKHRALQKAREYEEKMVTLGRALEVLKE